MKKLASHLSKLSREWVGMRGRIQEGIRFKTNYARLFLTTLMIMKA